MVKLIKITKAEQIVDVIKKIKSLKGNEVIFEFPTGSPIFKNPHNLSLIKKSAGAMDKTVIVKTDDPNGRSLAAKAGLLIDDGSEPIKPVVKTIKTKKVKFGDIGAQTMPRPVAVGSAAAPVSIRPHHTEEQMMPEPELIRHESRNFFPRITSTFSKFFILGIVVLVLLVFGVAVILPQAQITVYARSEPIARDLEVSVDRGINTINSGRLIIPAEAVSREISHTKNFPSTGVKLAGTNAKGSIQLYNFTKNTLTLRAATTTLVIGGKKYSFVKDVTGLRPTARIGVGDSQEIDKSSLIAPVQIVAQVVGADYNIASNSRLEVQNTALGQADVYAVTTTALTGGSSTETKILSQADLDNAIKSMQDELGTLAQEEITASASNTGIIVENNAVKSEILAKTANKNVGDETPNFDMTIIAKVTGLSYHEQDVKTLIMEKIQSVLSEDKYLPENGKQELTAEFKAVDIDNGTGVLAVHFATVAAYKVENTNLSKILAGKNAVEIKEILLTRPEIDRVDVKFSPFFVNKAPRFNGKIYIETIESQS
ncbi:MAG: hypothetical protein KW793_02895 [Candidatus Doudnabacteria bacterium]|nr:hypothetical protein [Candidatus Doudnabacteria bacterium]